MTILSMRELLSFPDGNNATDTIINDIHFNRTALDHFNYTLYSNGTLSNGSNCWLAFEIYKPHMLWNGTFVNATSCYSPIKGLEARGTTGIAFASLFAATILFLVINLRKHGERLLPLEKRWTILGRRSQWYWMLFLATCGCISCFMSIDVDRDYLQSTAIVLQSFFYHLMLPIMLAVIWEAVRHWGSWQERQILDNDLFTFPAASTREKQELYMPLIFYLFAFLNFFMTIPRSWSSIQKQRSPHQQETEAKLAATDGRFKAGSILATVCIVIICYSLGHSMYRYKRRPHGRSRIVFWASIVPAKFVLVIILASVRIGFNIASSFRWSISPLKFDGNPGYLYGLGYAPPLLVLVVLIVYGYIEPNEDKALIAQRIERGRAMDAELGIEAGKRKPNWWRRLRHDFQPGSGDDPQERLRALTTQVGGGRATQRNIEQLVEMGAIDTGRYKDSDDSGNVQLSDPFKDQPGYDDDDGERFNLSRYSGFMEPEPRTERIRSNAGSQFTASSEDTLTSQARQQKVRSMLDI
ncbi:hypothetical protein FQN57_004941 [Myotisia sp. PD_48]|nr:hypothetical protein FQN57_004941 [Myotisia sp. PD_48]